MNQGNRQSNMLSATSLNDRLLITPDIVKVVGKCDISDYVGY